MKRAIATALLVVCALSVSTLFTVYAEDVVTATDAQKKVITDSKFNGIIPQIGSAKDEAVLRALITDSFADCGQFENYEKFVNDAKAASQDPAFNNKDYLNYAIALARINQLSCLSKNNDIESGRLYMSVNDKYFTEAFEYLDKVSNSTKSKNLMIDNNILKYSIFKEKLQPQKAGDTFDLIATELAEFSEDQALNRKELARASEQLKNVGLAKQAIKLRLLYASKVDPKAAQEVVDEIRRSADQYFSLNNMKDATALYEQYITAAPAYYTKEDMAAKVMEIGEKYFAAGKYKDARKYYEFYAEKYSDLPTADYGSYKLAIVYYNMKDHVRSISQLEAFLEKYKNSVWFDKSYEMLAKVYYENLPRDKAIESLRSLMDRYYREGAGDYARILTSMLYYGAKNYDMAEDEAKKIKPTSMYSYTAKMITDDIKEIRNNKKTPVFGSDASDTYKVWDPYKPAEVKVTATVGPDTIPAVVSEDGAITMEVAKGAKVQFALQGMVDDDRFSEYQMDKDDPSRLPKMIREETAKDILSLHWASESGKFADDKETDVKSWQAPNEPGTYTISVKVDDLGLVRVPDKGTRKDSMKDVNIVMVVK